MAQHRNTRRGIERAAIGFVGVLALGRALPAPPGNASPMSSSGSAVACTSNARLAFETAYSSALPGYIVAGVRIATGPACAGHAFDVTLAAATQHGVRVSGTLDRRGSASPRVRSLTVPASDLTVGITIR